MFRRIIRIAIGFSLACLAAALVITVFAYVQEIKSATSADAQQLLSDSAMRVLRLATIGALFSAPIALVGIWFGEWRRIQDWAYYAVLALIIALIGFLARYRAESVDEGTIINNFAMTAFLTSGFVGGLIYWLFSGHNAGKPFVGGLKKDTLAGAQVTSPAVAQADKPDPPSRPKPIEKSKAEVEIKTDPAKPERASPEVSKPDLTKPATSLSEKVEQVTQTVEEAATADQKRPETLNRERVDQLRRTLEEGAAADLTKPATSLPEKVEQVTKTFEDAAAADLTKPATSLPEKMEQLKKTVEEAAESAEEAAKTATSVPETAPGSKKT